MANSPRKIPVTPLLTGAAAARRLDQIAGAAQSRRKIFVPTLNAARHGFGVPGRLAPPSVPGHRAWGDGTEELRLRFEPFGGFVPADGGLNAAGVVMTADGTTAIALVSGDESTGLSAYVPQVRYPRGRVTAEYVQGNLFEGFSDAVEQFEWWFLLHLVKRDYWRAELSLAAGVNGAGWVTGWKERVQVVSDDPGDDGVPMKVRQTPDLPTPTVRWRESA